MLEEGNPTENIMWGAEGGGRRKGGGRKRVAFCDELTSHPRGKGLAIIPSRFMLQELKLDAGLMSY